MVECSVELQIPPDDVTKVHDMLSAFWVEVMGVNEMDRMAFETALIELASNVVQHASPTRQIVCAIKVTAANGNLDAVLTDSADPPEGDVSKHRGMPDEMAESGRGIAFIQLLVTQFHYQRVRGSNVWRIARTRGVQ